MRPGLVSSALAGREGAQRVLNLFHQPGELNRLGVIVHTAGFERSLAISAHGVSRERNHGQLFQTGEA